MYNIFQTYLATLSKSRLTLSNSRLWSITRQYCNNTDELNIEKEKEIERITKNASLDEPPTACCRSGCANCVFIVWAEALASKMQDAGPEIAEKIMKMVDDPSMRAYLELELRVKYLIHGRQQRSSTTQNV